MKIKGDESFKELEKYCCPSISDDTQDYLILDDKCIRSLLEECRRICLYDFAVPIDEIIEMTKELGYGQTLSLEDFRVAVVHIVNNESVLWRQLDEYTVDNRVMRYKYDSSITIDDINVGESVPAKLSFSMDANDSGVIINWNNISDTIVDHNRYQYWKDAINTWRNMSPERVTNTVILPKFSVDVDVNLFLDSVENKLSNTVEFEVGNDDIKYRVTAFVEYHIDNDTTQFVVQKVELCGIFIDPDVIFEQDGVSHVLESSTVVISNTGDFVTLTAKAYSSVRSLLVLSSKTIVQKLELFNDNSVTRRVKILLAK